LDEAHPALVLFSDRPSRARPAAGKDAALALRAENAPSLSIH
jgi:hypothetical protein